MALTVAATVQALIAQDPEFLKVLFEEDFPWVDATQFEHGGGRRIKVASAATDTVSLEGITAAGYLFVKSDRQVIVQLTNAQGVDQKVVLGNAADDEGFLLLVGAYTVVKIENQSGADAAVVVAYAGNES